MKIDADEKELRESVERGDGSPPRVASESVLGTPATRRPRSARIDG